MRVYELALVLKTSLSEAQRKKFLETVKTWLKGHLVTKETEWGQKVLSYPVKHEMSGFYSVLTIESEAVFLTGDIERRLIAHENVLRHLLVRKK